MPNMAIKHLTIKGIDISVAWTRKSFVFCCYLSNFPSDISSV